MELYDSDLEVLSKILGYVEDVSREPGVFEVEIRVRLSEGNSWAVVGWGEAGDPCVLRFEEDPKPVVTLTRDINPFTINKDYPLGPGNKLGVGEYNRFPGD